MDLRRTILTVFASLAVAGTANAGPIAYGICQTGMSTHLHLDSSASVCYTESNPTHLNAYGTGCNTVAVACYAAAGATFGTVIAAAAAPAAVLACNAALGTCSAACASVTLLAPTP